MQPFSAILGIALLATSTVVSANDSFTIPVSVNPNAVIPVYQLTLENNEVGDLPKKLFREAFILSNQTTIKLHSIAIADQLLAIMAGLTDKTDAIQFGEIESNIDASEELKLLQILTKIGNERRHVEKPAEWAHLKHHFHHHLRRACFNAYLFATGFIEVFLDDQTTSDHRFFIQIATLLNQAQSLDVSLARLTLLQSLAFQMFNKLDQRYQMEDPIEEKKILCSLIKTLVKTKSLSTQTEDQPTLGLLLMDLHHLYRASTAGHSDLQIDQIDFSKQICLLKLIHDAYPIISGLDQVNELVQIQKLNCRLSDL